MAGWEDNFSENSPRSLALCKAHPFRGSLSEAIPADVIYTPPTGISVVIVAYTAYLRKLFKEGLIHLIGDRDSPLCH